MPEDALMIIPLPRLFPTVLLEICASLQSLRETSRLAKCPGMRSTRRVVWHAQAAQSRATLPHRVAVAVLAGVGHLQSAKDQCNNTASCCCSGTQLDPAAAAVQCAGVELAQVDEQAGLLQSMTWPGSSILNLQELTRLSSLRLEKAEG